MHQQQKEHYQLSLSAQIDFVSKRFGFKATGEACTQILERYTSSHTNGPSRLPRMGENYDKEKAAL